MTRGIGAIPPSALLTVAGLMPRFTASFRAVSSQATNEASGAGAAAVVVEADTGAAAAADAPGWEVP